MNAFHKAIFCTLLVPLVSLAHTAAGGAHEASTSAAGRAGDPAQVSRTVSVGMADAMRFAPATLVVARGETLRIIARNDGLVVHELVLGTASEIVRHREAMRRDPGMSHAAPYMAHVDPGASGEIVWQFSQSGKFEYACLLPGHYEAGMRGSITVS